LEKDADICLDFTTIEGHAKSTVSAVDPNLLESRIQDMNDKTFSQQCSSVELNLEVLVQIQQGHQNPRALKSSKNYTKIKAGVSIYCGHSVSTLVTDIQQYVAIRQHHLPTRAGVSSFIDISACVRGIVNRNTSRVISLLVFANVAQPQTDQSKDIPLPTLLDCKRR
jgi:hypothetical protein